MDPTLFGTLYSPRSQVSKLHHSLGHAVRLLFPSLLKHCTIRGYNDVPWSNSEVCWNEPSVQSQGTLCPQSLPGGRKKCEIFTLALCIFNSHIMEVCINIACVGLLDNYPSPVYSSHRGPTVMKQLSVLV